MFRTNVIVVWEVGKADPIEQIVLCLIRKERFSNNVHYLLRSEFEAFDYNDVTLVIKWL